MRMLKAALLVAVSIAAASVGCDKNINEVRAPAQQAPLVADAAR